MSAPARRDRLAAPAWCLFDWANSPFPTVVITFVFAVYFQRGIVGDPVEATALWGWAISLSALAVAALAPLLGAAAAAGARRKPWLAACSLVTPGRSRPNTYTQYDRRSSNPPPHGSITARIVRG